MKTAVLTALLLALLALLAIGLQPLAAQDTLMESIFLPPRFFVGDRVELRLTYDVPAGAAVEKPAQLPVHAWVEFESIEVQDRRAKGGEVVVRVFFIPFFSGETVLPSIRFGELETGELLVSTESALRLEQDHSLRGLRRQLNLPLTWLRLLTLAAIGIGVPAASLLLLRYGILGVRRLREARLRRLPYLHARKSLNQLAAGRASMDGKPFFTLLSLTMRRYLSERLALPLMSVTTAEIRRELSRAGLEEPLGRRVHDVLKAADLIKFSGKRANRREMAEGLEAADHIVRQLEERTTHVEA